MVARARCSLHLGPPIFWLQPGEIDNRLLWQNVLLLLMLMMLLLLMWMKLLPMPLLLLLLHVIVCCSGSRLQASVTIEEKWP